MRRFVVRNHKDEPICDLTAPGNTESIVRTDEVNGVHSLEVRTTQQLEKGNRIIYEDGTGRWREYVVVGIEQTHDSSGTPTGRYYCVWSLQHDLENSQVNRVIDHRSPVRADIALDYALEGTARWNRGTVDFEKMAYGSMYYRNGYEALGVVTERWGGEVESEILVDESTGRITRKVNLRAKVGNQDATRRFDYTHDITSITRKVEDQPVTPRILPVGAGQQTEAGGYSRKVHIGDVNEGIDWLQDDSVAEMLRIPDGSGGWEYPCQQVENGDIEDAQELKDWAVENIEKWTRPKVTYDADVLQFAEAGLDAKGISEGDAVHVVDHLFCEGGLRLGARVQKLVVNELDTTDQKITIGNISEGLAGTFKALSAKVGRAVDMANASSAELMHMSTAQYVSELIGRMNDEINATGGYTYIVEGEGLLTYDRPVSDPTVGSEANQVVQIKGGNIRIANTRTSGGDWNWRTVIQSGHIAADLVTAAQITTGYIGSAGSDYWLLGNGGRLETYSSKFHDAEVTGTFATGSGNYTTRLENARLKGYYNGAELGFIDYSGVYENVRTHATYRGLQLKANQVIGIDTPRLWVKNPNYEPTSEVAKEAFSGIVRQHVVTGMLVNPGGTISEWYDGDVELHFVNGILYKYVTVS